VDAPWLAFRERLRAFVARRLRNPADVDDVVQAVLLQLHRKRDQIRSGERIHAWLYTTARRAIADYYRSGSRRREVASGDGADLEALQTGAGSGTQTSPDERAQVASCLTPVLSRLAPSDREAIVLTELEGLRVADAAARAGVSISGMKSRTRRARVRLRSAILACCDVALDARGAPIGCAQRDNAGATCPQDPAP